MCAFGTFEYRTFEYRVTSHDGTAASRTNSGQREHAAQTVVALALLTTIYLAPYHVHILSVTAQRWSIVAISVVLACVVVNLHRPAAYRWAAVIAAAACAAAVALIPIGG